mgnify:CR=1 FL=1
MEKDLIGLLLGGGLLIFLCVRACKKRMEETRRCPRCGNICNASPWSTGLINSYGSPVYSFKCKNCGFKFLG